MSDTTSPYEITLTRWNSKLGERRTNRSRISATDFAQAVQMAHLMLRAAAEADPDRDYKIASVQQTGFHGVIECESGWQTHEEWAAANGLREEGEESDLLDAGDFVLMDSK